LEAVRYNYAGDPVLANFSFDGATLFVRDAPDDPEVIQIAAVDTSTGAKRQLTSTNDPWISPLGDAFGRLLVVSEENFAWLDPTSGDRLSEPFVPDAGTAVIRLRVEPDGSAVMIADPVSGGSNSGQGLYVFGPDGSSLMRFSSPRANFSWLAVGWENTSLVSYFSEVHLLPSRSNYQTTLSPP
ncbi:MAG: hypothetical protein AAF658_13190, partial [Myxococcota bacterium]